MIIFFPSINFLHCDLEISAYEAGIKIFVMVIYTLSSPTYLWVVYSGYGLTEQSFSNTPLSAASSPTRYGCTMLCGAAQIY